MVACPFEQGDFVRPIHNPGRVGTVTRLGCREVQGVVQAQVAFTDGATSWLRASLLERVPIGNDPEREFVNGRTVDAPSLLRILMHEKLGGRLADVLYSMEASDTRFLPYQFKPVLKLIESPCNSLLIADEVGLGKTIEAGLIWTELRARAAAHRLLVVCPAKLKEKWVRELSRRFGTRAQEAGARDLLDHLREFRRNPSHGFALVASYQSLRPTNGWKDLEPGTDAQTELAHMLSDAAQTGPLFDLLVMDEAHYMRNSETLTFDLGQLATDVTSYRVFLSATPLHTSNTNLFSLLRLLDPDTFDSEQTFAGILEANAPLVRLRDAFANPRSTIDQVRGHLDGACVNAYLSSSAMLTELREAALAPGALDTPSSRVELAYRAERVNMLGHAVSRTRKRDVFTENERVYRDVKAYRVGMSSEERDVYETICELGVEFAVSHSLPLGFLAVTPQRLVSSSIYAALKHWTDPSFRRLSDFDDEDDEEHPFVDFLRGRLQGRFDLVGLRHRDSKFKLFLRELTQYWRDNPGKKIILFSSFHPTINYLSERLKEAGITTLVIKGGAHTPPQEVLDCFEKPDGSNLLLSTEVGGEGLDMQFASTLINYDLPWNPMVVEQRIGRIDRIGQEARRINVLSLLHKDTIDERIYDRLYDRLDLFRNSIGELEAVVGPVLNEMQRALLKHTLDPQEQAEIIETAEQAIEAERQARDRLEESASLLAAYGDYLRNQIQAKHDLEQWVTGDEIERYVCDFFANQAPETRLVGLEPTERLYEVQMDLTTFAEFDQFLGLNNMRGHTRISSASPVKIRFDHRLFAKTSGGIELVSQSHALVRFVAEQTRQRQLVQCAPVAISLDRAGSGLEQRAGIYLVNVQRWDVDGLRQFARLRFDARERGSDGPLDEKEAQALIEAAARHGRRWPAWEQVVPVERGSQELSALDDGANEAFIAFEKRCIAENDDRARVQLTSVARFEDRQNRSIRIRIENHERTGNRSLKAAEEGKLAKLRERCELQRKEIERKAAIKAASTRLCFGLVRLE